MSSIKPKTKAVRKPKVKAVRKGVYFQSRGPAHTRCVKVDGVNKGGVHKAIEQKLCPFNYDLAKKHGMLQRLAMPASNYFIASAGCAAIGRTRRYPPGCAKQQGSKMDREASFTSKQLQLPNV